MSTSLEEEVPSSSSSSSSSSLPSSAIPAPAHDDDQVRQQPPELSPPIAQTQQQLEEQPSTSPLFASSPPSPSSGPAAPPKDNSPASQGGGIASTREQGEEDFREGKGEEGGEGSASQEKGQDDSAIAVEPGSSASSGAEKVSGVEMEEASNEDGAREGDGEGASSVAVAEPLRTPPLEDTTTDSGAAVDGIQEQSAFTPASSEGKVLSPPKDDQGEDDGAAGSAAVDRPVEVDGSSAARLDLASSSSAMDPPQPAPAPPPSPPATKMEGLEHIVSASPVHTATGIAETSSLLRLPAPPPVAEEGSSVSAEAGAGAGAGKEDEKDVLCGGEMQDDQEGSRTEGNDARVEQSGNSSSRAEESSAAMAVDTHGPEDAGAQELEGVDAAVSSAASQADRIQQMEMDQAGADLSLTSSSLVDQEATGGALSESAEGKAEEKRNEKDAAPDSSIQSIAVDAEAEAEKMEVEGQGSITAPGSGSDLSQLVSQAPASTATSTAAASSSQPTTSIQSQDTIQTTSSSQAAPAPAPKNVSSITPAPATTISDSSSHVPAPVSDTDTESVSAKEATATLQGAVPLEAPAASAADSSMTGPATSSIAPASVPASSAAPTASAVSAPSAGPVAAAPAAAPTPAGQPAASPIPVNGQSSTSASNAQPETTSGSSAPVQGSAPAAPANGSASVSTVVPSASTIEVSAPAPTSEVSAPARPVSAQSSTSAQAPAAARNLPSSGPSEEEVLAFKVTVLLKVNREIIKVCVEQQNVGAFAIEKNVDLITRMQSNLSYLAYKADPTKMDRDAPMPRLDLPDEAALPAGCALPSLYKQLQALFHRELIARQDVKGKKRMASDSESGSAYEQSVKRQALMMNGGVAHASAQDQSQQASTPQGTMGAPPLPRPPVTPVPTGPMGAMAQVGIDPRRQSFGASAMPGTMLGGSPQQAAAAMAMQARSMPAQSPPAAAMLGSPAQQAQQPSAPQQGQYPAATLTPQQAQSLQAMFGPNAVNNYNLLQAHLRGQPQAFATYMEQQVPGFRQLPLQIQLQQMQAMQSSAVQRQRQAQLSQAQTRGVSGTPPPSQSPYGTPDTAGAMGQMQQGGLPANFQPLKGSPSGLPAGAIQGQNFTPSPRMNSMAAPGATHGSVNSSAHGSRPSTPGQPISHAMHRPGSSAGGPPSQLMRTRNPSMSSSFGGDLGQAIAMGSPLRTAMSPGPSGVVAQSPLQTSMPMSSQAYNASMAGGGGMQQAMANFAQQQQQLLMQQHQKQQQQQDGSRQDQMQAPNYMPQQLHRQAPFPGSQGMVPNAYMPGGAMPNPSDGTLDANTFMAARAALYNQQQQQQQQQQQSQPQQQQQQEAGQQAPSQFSQGSQQQPALNAAMQDSNFVNPFTLAHQQAGGGGGGPGWPQNG